MTQRSSSLRRLSCLEAIADPARLRVPLCLGVSLLIAMLGAGCGGGSDDAAIGSTATTNQQPQNVSRGAPVAPTQVQPQKLDLPQDADSSRVLEELNLALRRWVVSNRRMPSSFEEFTSTAQIQVPPAPAGKKYVLTKQMKVELADR
jgi:hypothetical protein